MRMRRGVRMAAAVAALVSVAVAAGCANTQLEERNMALQRQLEQSLMANAELQRQLDMQNQAPPPAPVEPVPYVPPEPLPPPPEPQQPDFGPGIEVSQVGDTVTVTLPNTILFDSGKADLKSQSKSVLDKVASVLKSDYPNSTIRVEGHTDNDPVRKSAKYWKDNWELSCERALAVLRYLEGRGIDSDRIYAAGFGPNKPIASNASAAGKAKNRRVEIVVMGK